jgi:hypothetical protein
MLANKNLNSVRGETYQEYGIEARRTQFTQDSYRQPVLTQKAMVPRSYRLGQVDPLTEKCRTRLKQLEEYSLMHDRETESSESDVQKVAREESVMEA